MGCHGCDTKAIRPVMVELISLAGVLPPGLLVIGVFLSVRGLSSVGSAPPVKLPGSLAPSP